MKLKPGSFRKGMKWLLTLAVFHVAAFVLYSVLLAGVTKERFMHGDANAAYITVLIFGLIFWLAVGIVWVVRGEMSYAEVRRNILTAAKEESFSFMGYFCRTFLTGWIWKTVFFLVLQSPFAILYANYGLMLDDSITIIEKLYIAEAGFYATTNSTLLGLVLSTVYFFVVMSFFSFLKYCSLLKNG